MAQEWYATCKDCGKEFGYSDASYQLSARRGMSRPERCPTCRQLHTREISTLGLSHFELTPVRPIPASGLKPGRLGGLIRPERIHQPKEQKPSFDYNKFGIKDQHICEYFEMMQKHQVTVIVAPTGAGKSTFLPFRLMSPPEPFPQDLWTRNGQIIITQPRIQATRNIPAFVAQDLHGSTLGAGFDVGFRHSGSPATDWRNKMVYMTDGTLINMIVRNEIGRLSVIMIDEAHERSLNIDLILGLLKCQLPRYPHLKLIIASATIDTDLFINYYGGADKVGFYEFPGKRKHPVETRFRDSDPVPENQFSGRMPDEVAKKAVEILLAMERNENPNLITMEVNGKQVIAKGDILGFLQGEKPIDRAVSLIQEMVEDEPVLAGKVDILPLYTKLPQKQQDVALKPKKDKNRWRVVISTNVAETSLTVEGIVHVIETGLINESQWDPETQTSFITPKVHSQAGCKQRWGRAGRVQPGIAHCLYTEEQFNNFPPHTFPEIVRAPLDQIVLTAKAAGVDSIKDFDWIQRPPEAELERAPYYLSQMGALDADGDLTEHGLELRSFAAETDVANLMILADRFGCAIEMATLIPMLKLGGYTKLLLWDRSWDAPTKRAVHRIHQGLIQPCLDDVEFYLKLWEVWEGSLFGRHNDKQRLTWSEQFFVNHYLFRKQIVPERESLLSSLTAHKKDEQARPIDFNFLTRLRIVLTYGLSSQIYQLANKPQPGQEMEEAPIYKPYIANPEANPELLKLHEDAVVEISPESICFDRQLPDYFVCGKRQRVRRRLSPQADPITIISAAFITLINPDWLQLIGQPPIRVARYLAANTRQADGQLMATTTAARLFIDQDYPVGAQYVCQVHQQDGIVEIGERERYAPIIRIGSSFEEVEAPDEIEILEAEGELDKNAGLDEKKVRVSVAPDEDAELPAWLDLIEEDNELKASTSSRRPPERHQTKKIAGRFVDTTSPAMFVDSLSGIVAGYDFKDYHQPIILLETPINPSPFQQFLQKYQPGMDVTVELLSVEKYVNDWLLYLVVREVETGLEIVLDPYDASLIGRNFVIHYLRQFEKGLQFRVTIEAIDEKARRVRATRLRVSENAMLQFMGKQKERTVDAAIVEVRDNGLYVWLEPSETRDHMPCGAFAYISRLPQRPDEMSLGQSCRAIVRPRQWQKPLRRSLTSLPEEVAQKLKQQRIGNNLEWDEQNHTLAVKGRINYEQRRKLLEMSTDGGYRRAINILFRRSNELDIKIIDVTGTQILRDYQQAKKPAPAKIISVDDRGVEVEVEGFRAWVPKHEAIYDPSENLQDKFKAGDSSRIYVKEVNEERGEAVVSLLNPAEDPLNDYQPGQILHGHIANIVDFGAYVELTPGVQGLVHISRLAWWRVERPTEIVHRGQSVKVLILDINREERQLDLTMCLPENDPLRQFEVNQRVQGKVVGFTNDGNGAFVELKPGVEGFLYKDEIHTERVPNARMALSDGQQVLVRITELDWTERKLRLTIRGLYETEIWVQDSHKGLVIGRGGSSIQDIQRDTKTYINLDDDGYCLIQGMNQAAVNQASQRIQTILATRIVTFSIQSKQIPMLIGRSGSTIKGIQSDTGAQIDVDSNANKVVVTAANDVALQKTLDQIRSVISFYEAVIQVPPTLAGRVIGQRGETINNIRNLTGVRIDVPKDGSGRIVVEGKGSYEVGRAVTMIQAKTGSATYLSVSEGTLPAYTEVRSKLPGTRRSQPTSKVQPIESRQPAILPTPKPQPVKPTTTSPKPAATPQLHQQEFSVNAVQIAKLTRKQGGFFVSLFGGGKSPVEKIQADTGVQIKIDTLANKIKVVGRSPQAVNQAVTALQQALR